MGLNDQQVQEYLFDSTVAKSTIKFPGLAPFASRLNCSADVLIKEHTNFPYKTAFQSGAQKDVIRDALLERPSDLNMQRSFGLIAGPCPGFTAGELRFCGICMSEAETAYGERYWRRVHQIPLVLVCPDHGCVLRKSTSIPAGLTRGLLVPTIHNTGPHTQLVFEGFGKAHQEFLRTLAQDCASLNRGHIPKIFARDLTQQSLKKTLIGKGFLAANHSDRWLCVHDYVMDIVNNRTTCDARWLRFTWPSLFDDDGCPKQWFRQALSNTKDRILPEYSHLSTIIVDRISEYRHKTTYR